MIRRLSSGTTSPDDIHPGLTAHQRDMVSRCPYLGPSVEKGLTVWSAVEAGPGDEAGLFAALVESAELLRRDRRELGPLACRNIAVLGPGDEGRARQLMQWPAWLARNLYAPVQLMVGRFWTGVRLTDSKGEAMMPPPVSFFSLRNAIPSKEGTFLAAKVPEILDVLAAGPGDDGRNVFTEPLGRAVATTDAASVYADLVRCFPVTGSGSGGSAAGDGKDPKR
ncbi:hypothetical protein MRI28_06870 [Nocardiopsis dassonvillei]|uniref:hypothetical protein n=1 Tax=Nocardiopsis dassonvillei TaxID=2014 RepID=UPI0020109BDB|nr:hypothetical protein [Nocardiopsis dassonvillei]MCK9869378.1 hypothetical protein [Nocardiopsis dassonvillei]